MRGQREHLQRFREGLKTRPVVGHRAIWHLAESARELLEVAATANLDEDNRERLGRAIRRINDVRRGLSEDA